MIIHWINRIINPVVHLNHPNQTELFMNKEIEHRETTDFFKGNYIPMGWLFNSMTTCARALLFTNNPESIEEYT